MIKAIIFDCFGVLAVDGWLPFKQQHFADKPDKLQQVTELNRQTDAGLVPYEDFIANVAEMARVRPDDFRAQIEQTVVDSALMDYIAAELKPKYQLGLLSNVAGHWLERKFTPEQRQLFDVVSLSSETGYVKPDSRAYEVVLDKLGLLANEVLFVDDRQGNCTAAAELGMKTIVYRDLQQFKRELASVA